MNKLMCWIGLLLITGGVSAKTVTSTMYDTSDIKKRLGDITFQDSPYGLLITPNLTKLPPGSHGFHLHQHANCGDGGMSAGGHFDPGKTGKHLGPYGDGHKGDLPVLYVSMDGIANIVMLAPRLSTADLKGLSIMIHQHGDNYTDQPALGGGGARIACGAMNEVSE